MELTKEWLQSLTNYRFDILIEETTHELVTRVFNKPREREVREEIRKLNLRQLTTLDKLIGDEAVRRCKS